MKEITGILIDANNQQCHTLTIKDELETYYELLDCSIIDIVERKINNKVFCVICDDEGLLGAYPIPSAHYKTDGNLAFVGNLFIVNQADENGELQSLTKEDIKVIYENIDKYPLSLKLNY